MGLIVRNVLQKWVAWATPTGLRAGPFMLRRSKLPTDFRNGTASADKSFHFGGVIMRFNTMVPPS